MPVLATQFLAKSPQNLDFQTRPRVEQATRHLVRVHDFVATTTQKFTHRRFATAHWSSNSDPKHANTLGPAHEKFKPSARNSDLRNVSAQYEQFGKYVLLEKLATGGMAEVFLARGSGAGGIGKFFAIKRILPQYADSPEFIEMFKAEAKIAINLKQSNIVSIHEFGVEKGQFFLVMDYVEGRNLRQILNKMKKVNLQFGIDQIVFVIKEVAAGLEHAHRCIDGATGKPLNITHRDMSPQNVMVSFDGEVKIVDFGIAKAESQLETTRAGTLKGKFGYMSPEQADGQNVDLRTDIFSLGIVLWELLANDRLFVANNEMNTLRKIRDCQIPSLRKINPNIHAELERIVQKALARDRNLRYQTGAAFQRDLNRFLNRQYPDFSAQDFSAFIRSVFTDEIMALRKRLVEYAKVNLNISLSVPSNINTVVNFETGETTNSQLSPNTNSMVSALTGNENPNEETNGPVGLQLTDGLPKELNLSEESFPEPQSEPKPRPITASGLVQLDPSTNSEIENADDLQSGTSTAQLPTQAVRDEKTERIAGDNKTRTLVGQIQNPPPVLPSPPSSGPDPKKPPGLPLLDETALAAEASRDISTGKRSQAPRLDTLEDHQIERSSPSQRNERRNYNRSAKSDQAPSEIYEETSSSPRVATLLVFLFLCGLVYVYLIRSFPNSMRDVILMTDPILHDVHLALGVKLTEEGSPQLPNPGPRDLASDLTSLTDSDADGLVVTTNPSGADILLNGQNTNVMTPGRITVPSEEPFSLTLRKKGYMDYRRVDVTRTQVGHRLEVSLVKLNIGYLDVEIFPPQEGAVLFVNGKKTALRGFMAHEVSIPGNTAITVRAESGNGLTYDEATITVPSDHRRLIKLNPRRLQRSPANSQ